MIIQKVPLKLKNNPKTSENEKDKLKNVNKFYSYLLNEQRKSNEPQKLTTYILKLLNLSKIYFI